MDSIKSMIKSDGRRSFRFRDSFKKYGEETVDGTPNMVHYYPNGGMGDEQPTQIRPILDVYNEELADWDKGTQAYSRAHQRWRDIARQLHMYHPLDQTEKKLPENDGWHQLSETELVYNPEDDLNDNGIADVDQFSPEWDSSWNTRISDLMEDMRDSEEDPQVLFDNWVADLGYSNNEDMKELLKEAVMAQQDFEDLWGYQPEMIEYLEPGKAYFNKIKDELERGRTLSPSERELWNQWQKWVFEDRRDPHMIPGAEQRPIRDIISAATSARPRYGSAPKAQDTRKPIEIPPREARARHAIDRARPADDSKVYNNKPKDDWQRQERFNRFWGNDMGAIERTLSTPIPIDNSIHLDDIELDED